MRRLRTPLILIAVTVVAAIATGCGSTTTGMLTQAQSDALNAALDRVDIATSNGDCTETAVQATALRGVVGELPPSVNSALRANLRAGAMTVESTSLVDCAKASTTTSTTSSSTSTSSSSTTTTSTTTPTTTTTEPTTTTTTDTGGGTPPIP
ncbi:MAG: hypothetical protein F2799_00800 [Actinobacteria bacterium]|uniref:Unannotated protein n=1 Tax=freshwater metagenome TaxID=449393 RepID=A0A6J7CVI0_9ZZZZ|nr:hypothetical protein [Actinomycetota bacterium]